MSARLPAQSSSQTPAKITSPAPGSVLTDSTVKFSWSGASLGVTGYILQVITTGAFGIQLPTINKQLGAWETSTDLSGLPSDCSTITVSLITQYSVQYGNQYVPVGVSSESSYIAAGPNAMATMTSPAPGSALGGASATFRWAASASSSAAGYQLSVGTTPGGGDLFSNKLTQATSQTINNLPTNGTPICVRLSTLLGGVWANNDYTYVAAGGLAKSGATLQHGVAPGITPPIVTGGTTQPTGGSGGTATKAAITSPVPGTMLGGSTVTFTWDPGTGASEYWLYVGTTVGSGNLFSHSMALATSQTVTGLPIDGSTVYVRLGTKLGTAWEVSDSTYTAATPTKAVMISPAAGTTLGGSTVSFNWTAGAGASEYWLYVGTTVGSGNLFSHSMALATNQTVTGLPTDGSAIYVRLATKLGSAWEVSDSTYTAAGGGTSGAKAVMASPTPGSTLAGSSVTFSWNAASGATAYGLHVGSSLGGNNLFSLVGFTATTYPVTGLPADGSTIYVRLWTQFGSVWQSNDYTYTAAGGATGGTGGTGSSTGTTAAAAAITSPASGSTLSGSTVTFTWNAVSGATGYALVVGTATNNTSVFNQNVGQATSQTVTGIPTDGSYIFVRLYTVVGGTTLYNDYNFKTSAPTAAAISSPAPGSTLSGSSATFTWNAVPGATGYTLVIGTATNNTNVFNQSLGVVTSQTVSGIPTDGSYVFVRLYTSVGGATLYNDYNFKTSAPTAAVISSPAPSSTLSGSTVTFTWNAVSGATGYALVVGTATNNTSVFNQNVGQATSQSVIGIPTDGSYIFVRLYTVVGGTTLYNDYSYKTGGGTTGTPPGAPVPPAVKGAVAPALPTAGTLKPVAATAAPAPPAAGATTPRPLVAPGAAVPTLGPAPAAAGAAPGSDSAALLANFPIFSGATRTAFSSSRGKSTWQERGNYNVALTPDSAGPAYAQQLGAAGWNELSRTQSGDAGAKNLQFTVDLQNGQTRGHVVLTQNTGGSGVMAIVTTLYPGNSAPALGTGATAAPATGAATSTSDRGAHDPADFPRLPGSVRASFTSTSQKTSAQEIATYTAKCAPAAADAFYDQNLPGAGWDELTRDENLNDATKGDQISAKWQNGSRTAVIALSGSTAGGCDVRVSITTQTAP